MPAPASGTHATEKGELFTMWRQLACAAVALLCLCCRWACQLQRQYKDSRQVVKQCIVYLVGALSLIRSGFNPSMT